MNDLVQSMVLAGGQWTGSTENLEVPDDISTGKRRKELGAMAFSTTAINFSTVNSSAAFRSKQLVNNKGIGRLLFALCCDTVGNGNSNMTFLCTFFFLKQPEVIIKPCLDLIWEKFQVVSNF